MRCFNYCHSFTVSLKAWNQQAVGWKSGQIAIYQCFLHPLPKAVFENTNPYCQTSRYLTHMFFPVPSLFMVNQIIFWWNCNNVHNIRLICLFFTCTKICSCVYLLTSGNNDNDICATNKFVCICTKELTKFSTDTVEICDYWIISWEEFPFAT